MQHFSGMHCTLDMRTAYPLPFLAFFPATIEQSQLDEKVTFLDPSSRSFPAGHPPRYEPLEARETYDTASGKSLSSFGPTKPARFGDVALARSGDKGSNQNIGIFVHTGEEWEWLRSFLSIERMKALMGEDWREEFSIERVEFPHLKAVHFVIYGLLGRGVSSSSRLDALGKGFADFVRDVWVDVPLRFLGAGGKI
jgi:hypothetical protein